MRLRFQHRVINVLVFSLISFFIQTTSCLAMGGTLRRFDPIDLKSNWRVNNPKIVVAYGLFEPALMSHYNRFFRESFEPEINKINPAIKVEIIPEVLRTTRGPVGATGAEVVQALQDPDTVGLIFIAHTFKTQNAEASISLSGDGHPLPVSILSAATPGLRFVAILGCNGPGILTEYEIKYAYDQLPGHQAFYYNQDKLLSANFLGVDNLKKVLKKIASELNHLEMMDLLRGDAPPAQPAGKLTIRVKDVYAQLEPRYIYVNGKIVGMLGSNAENSNHGLEYEELSYDIPHTALRKRDSRCDKVKIAAAELSPSAPADNYLIESIKIHWNDTQHLSSKTYNPPLHLGLPENREFHPDHGITLEGTLEERREQYLRYIRQSWIAAEWLDRDPKIWNTSPWKARFFIDCI